MNPVSVEKNAHLTFHYRLSLQNGQDIVNTFIDKPATLLLGAGQFASSLEAILMTMKEGDHSAFQLKPEEAFGLRNPDLLQWITLSTLDKNSEGAKTYMPGDIVEFNAPNGSRYAGVLKEKNETLALFDFNHPLAGQPVSFEVKIIAIL